MTAVQRIPLHRSAIPISPAVGETSTALPIASELFRGLNEAGVRYGIFQDLATLPEALAGRDDLDMLVDKRDYPAFCAIASRLHGRRGVNLSVYDNVCAGREDWFVPDFSRGRYLHLDTHIGVRVGREFRKRYLAFAYGSISRWERIDLRGVTVPIASREDEVRLAIARFAFRVRALSWKQWATLPVGWDDRLERLPSLPGGQGVHVAEYSFGKARVAGCRIRQGESRVLAHRGDLAALRRFIREVCGFGGSLGTTDAAIHLARKCAYLAARFLQRAIPGSLPPKRRPAAGGIVVAVIGPDGVGKSTQVERLTRTLGWKFGCVQVYGGTGEGSGWWLRKVVRNLAFAHRRRLRAVIRQGSEARSWRRRAKSRVVAAGSALWGLLTALERYSVMRRAHRAATRGSIVVCDRWPQSLRAGYLDGPTIPPPQSSVRGLNPAARLERHLYRRMDELRPHLILHLVADHAVSARRKPGEISKEAFDARVELMAEMRTLDKDIRTVDAGGSLEAVHAELFKHIWLAL